MTWKLKLRPLRNSEGSRDIILFPQIISEKKCTCDLLISTWNLFELSKKCHPPLPYALKNENIAYGIIFHSFFTVNRNNKEQEITHTWLIFSEPYSIYSSTIDCCHFLYHARFNSVHAFQSELSSTPLRPFILHQVWQLTWPWKYYLMGLHFQ